MSEPDEHTDLISEALKSVEEAEAMVRGASQETPAEHTSAQPTGEASSAAPSQAAAASAAELESLKSQLEFSMAKGRELMDKMKDEHEKMLRAVADLENYKKRAQKEKDEIQKFGIEKLLRDFLPVVDNFDRALGQNAGALELESLKKGVEMIRKLFEDALGKHGVKSFTSKGELFDPNRHEAMSAAETDELPPNHVFSEYLRGFTLNDRLVRPALVVVSRAKASPEKAAEPSPSSETDSSSGEAKS